MLDLADLIACFPSKSSPKTRIRRRLKLEIVQHLPTFGGDDEYTLYDQKMDRSWNGMQKTPDGRVVINWRFQLSKRSQHTHSKWQIFQRQDKPRT